MSAETGCILPQEAQRGGWMIVDVRSLDERRAECVPGSVHLPLEQVESGARTLQAGANRVALLCKSGTRAQLALERLAACGVQASVIEGGLDRWKRDGLPVEAASRTRWSLERQVRLGAGVLVVASLVAAVTLSYKWLWLTLLVGCGLTFAGATDICMMGLVLAKMPWNGPRKDACKRATEGGCNG